MKLSNTYEILDAVVRSGSFRKAADKMAITSTALNRRILALEQELGVSLFERLPHGVKPTVAGDTLDVSGRKVDLASIATPSPGQHCRRKNGSSWPCGQNAAFALANIVARHWVHCRIATEDGAAPVPGYCTLAGPTGPDVNAAMLQQGWARTTNTAPDHYRALEASARKARLGIWGDGAEVASGGKAR